MVLLSGILRQPTINRALCLTEDCARHAALLTKYLNRTLDPCEDYAAFVCSAWEPAKTHIELARSAIDDLRFTWYKHFMDTLASGSLKISAGRKPLAMYDMCLKKFPYNASQMALIRDILHSQGLSWPEQPPKLQQPLTMFVAFSYKWLMSFWITVYVRHPRPSGRRHVFVSPGLYIPILLNHHRSVAQSYARYWQQFLLLFYPDLVDRPPMDENHINRIRIMEEYILTRLYQEVKSPRKKPALFSFKDIGSHLRNASTAEWVRDFQAGLLLQPELTADDQIIVTDIAFLATVTKLLDTYSTKQLNMHVSWLIMQYLTIAGDYSVLVRYYGSLETADKLLPIYCSHHVEVVFKVLISALGFFSRFTARDREAIDTGFNSLVSAAVDRINHSSWLDNESKIRARKKLSSVRAAIWPPTSLLNNETLEKIYANFPEKEPSYAHYWLSGRKAANTVNMTQGYDEALMLLGNHFPVYADYNYVYNVVKLAMATASPPAFYRNGTKGMLYGGLLFIMAMQLARAIDGEGIQWSANRTADENTILSSFSLQEFHAREKCQHGEGNSSVFPEVPAVEIAYAALTASLRDADWLIDIAPDLPEKKVFFMTLCYMTCASPGARNAISADCNKVVRNSDAFAEVYGCPKGSNMNPVKKCSFFS
ncbi:endothelin-converting enzyme 2-like [Amblyomma americanum]